MIDPLSDAGFFIARSVLRGKWSAEENHLKNTLMKPTAKTVKVDIHPQVGDGIE